MTNLTKTAEESLKIFKDFIRKDETVAFVEVLRKHLNIPHEGISFTEKSFKELRDSSVFIQWHVPKEVRKLFPDEDKKFPIRVVNTCQAFMFQQGIKSMKLSAMFNLYIFYNQVIDEPLRVNVDHDDYMRIEHLPSELSWYDDQDHYLLKRLYSHFEYTAENHPVAIYINPKVSQRQIQDFIAKNWKSIIAYRDKNSSTILRKKSSAKQLRNDFIYNHKDLPRKKIMKMVNDKFTQLEPVEYANVGKIISLERKRRENK
jgi:hypothetical protein